MALPAPSSAGQPQPVGAERSEQRPDEEFGSEVQRINAVATGPLDFINILGINAVATVRSQHAAAAKKRYKDIMLILHPDKRPRYSEHVVQKQEERRWCRGQGIGPSRAHRSACAGAGA